MDVLRRVLELPTDVAPIASPVACFEALERLDAELGAAPPVTTVDRAAAGGFAADRLGYAFVAGYRAALLALDPSLSRASLCASEEGGAHPRAIQTSLAPKDDAFALDGSKTFATLASAAETLLVVAKTGVGEGGRSVLRVVRVPSRRAGITLRDREAIAFAPEIPHARVTFASVRVEPGEVLAGDGYERVLKPFRTLEDLHVAAAWLGLVVRLARAWGEPRELVERSLAALAALRELGARSPLDPATHVALAGVLAEATAVAEGCTLASADEPTRARWRRDLPLLAVAGAARELRRDAAHRFFRANEPPAP